MGAWKGLPRLITSDGPGGTVVRRLLPVSVGVVALLAFLRWQGERQGLFGSGTGVVLLTAAAIGVLAGLLWYFAGRLDRSYVRSKSSEAALRRHGRYFELSHDMLCTAGFDGVFQEVNAAWTKTLGWSESELTARPFVEFVHPDDRHRTEQQSAGLAVGGVTVGFVNRYETADGGWRWLDWSAMAVPEEELIVASARDITERKEAEEAQIFLAAMVESSSDAIVGQALDGSIVSWNAGAERLYGYTAEEAVGKPAAMLVPPGRSDEIKHGERDERIDHLETVRVDAHGRLIEVELALAPITNASGEPTGASVVSRDISGRKLAQRYATVQHEATRVLASASTVDEALESLLRAIGEPMGWPVGAFWMPSGEGDRVELGCAAFWHGPGLVPKDFEAATRRLKVHPGTGLPGRVFDSRQPRWVTNVGEEPDWRRGGAASGDGLHACILLPIVSGETCLAVIELVSDEIRPPDPALLEILEALSGQIGHFLERKRSEAALEASERQTRQILETAHDAFVSIDDGGLITDWNPQAEATFGWSCEEVLGRDLADTIIPGDLRGAHRRGMERFLASGEGPVLGKLLELTATHRDGHEFPIELTISALETGGSFSFNAFLRDITERKRSEGELAMARDQALEASKMKSMFVANVSHEIRTPMNGVIGMTGLLLDTELDDEQREYAETVSASGEALLAIIDDILDFSKIEAGKLDLDPTSFDVREMVERACGMLAARAHAKGLELAVAIDAEMPAKVLGDAARLSQVVANFVSNAIKFTPEGEVVVRAGVVGEEGGLPVLRIDVTDTGIGIDHPTLAQLFKPFSQADASTTRRYGGTGLGLAISRQLIELMGGRLGAQSEVGKGSSFWFELALPRAGDGDRRSEQERELAGLRALVVDDNATNRTLLEQQLSSWEMSCDVAEGASQALELLEAATTAGRPYALALIDLNMPDVDGCGLARAIRARPTLRTMRLLLLTSSGGRPESAEGVGIDGFLTKPVRQSRLYEEIQAAMGDGPLVGELAELRRGPLGASDPRNPVKPTVLVVEDTPVNQTVATRMLEKLGCRTRVAGNGREALAALAEDSFAAVFMDCQMPELDGYEATRAIRRSEQGKRHTPIIAMTANTMQGDRARCLAAGMDDYLGKPLRARALEEALKRWISHSAGRADLTPSGTVATNGQARRPNGESTVLEEAVIANLESLDGDVLPELISLYFGQAASLLADLKRALGQVDAPVLAKAAHKLNGSSATIGAARVSDIARDLEAQAKAEDLSDAEVLLHRLEGALDETERAFRDRLAAVGGK